MSNTEPQATPEITAYLEAVAAYTEQADQFPKADIKGRYYANGSDPAKVIAHNTAEARDIITAAKALIEAGAAIEAIGETIALAAKQYRTDRAEWERAAKEEADRPRREWETAKADLVRSLEKEQRSLSIKVGRLNNKRWAIKDETARAEMDAMAEQMEARKRVIELTLNDVEWMRYSDYEGTTFTDDLVAKAATRNRARIAELTAKIEAEILAMADRAAE